jgi:NAD+ synthase (glutamine-hydrolysing)
MPQQLRVVMAQINLLVGDVHGNTSLILDAARRAQDEIRADAIVFPELAITGYPPEDLLLRPELYERAARALERIREEKLGIDIVVGYPELDGGRHYNAASVIRNGSIIATYYKQCLPNYAVFDEKRYFTPGTESVVFDLKGIPTALTICEDIWEPGPSADAVKQGARLLLNLNASPYHMTKWRQREETVIQRSRETGVPVIYVNLVGGQDELVFDGDSFVVNGEGVVTQRAPAFEAGLVAVDLHDGVPVVAESAPELADDESVYRAIVLGVRDYVNKNGFPGVVLGLSGGIDSALTLAIAVDALGPERVEAAMMPSAYTREISVEDATAEAEKLGVHYTVIPIAPVFEAFRGALEGRFRGLPADVTEENLQARIRGTLLMAISNKSGAMVLTTGNKSEMAVGYATLYGDMVGGFGAIKDVPKTLVYRLARYRNGISDVIPTRVLIRAPSAELAPDQEDTDSLPPYEILDPILERYVEHDASVEDIVAAGFDETIVRRVVRMVDRNEYKRRQAAPGVRVTPRAFGRDRRYPITSGMGREESR